MADVIEMNQGSGEENKNEILELFKPYEHFSKCLLDAYAIIDLTGKVIKCSASLSNVVGLKTKQILKEASIDSMLALSIGNRSISAKDFISLTSPSRFDEVSAKVAEGKLLNLIIGVYPFIQDDSVKGAFILLRDVTAETNLQGKYSDTSHKSVTDALTQLYNRGYFTDYLASQMPSLESFPPEAPQRLVSVVMMDIDFFKKVNDVYGHQAGDYVIKSTAEILKKSFRKSDLIARYGGEEFLAIMPTTDLQGATIAAEKFRKAVAEYDFVFEGTKIPLTISLGIAQINVGQETGEHAISRADQALYYSKKNGRNRCSVHDGAAIRDAASITAQFSPSVAA